MPARDYDSTVARIAGNILSGYPVLSKTHDQNIRAVRMAVAMARGIVVEVKSTELKHEPANDWRWVLSPGAANC